MYLRRDLGRIARGFLLSAVFVSLQGQARAQTPPAPGIPVGVAQSSSSILWTWAGVSGASGYRVYPASEPATLIASAPSIAFLEEHLSANTSASIVVSAFNGAGEGPQSAAGAAFSFAVKPVALSTTSVFASSVSLSWTVAPNPASTVSELQRSDDGGAFATVSSAPLISFTDQGLSACTTYSYRVQAINGEGFLTGFSSSVTFVTQDQLPVAPSGTAAASLSGRRIRVTWTASIDSEVTGYRIYSDGGSGVVDYSTPLGAVGSTVTEFTTGALTAGLQYRFAVRSVHRCGDEDGDNERVASATAVESPPSARTVIEAPKVGRRVTGNRVTVWASASEGRLTDIEQVRFQFKASSASAWTDIPAADASHPNPDTAEPFYTHWNTLALPATSYDLRALATGGSGEDTEAPGISVIVDPADFEADDTDIGAGRIRRTQRVNADRPSVATASRGTGVQISEVTFPTGAINVASATVTIVNNPAAAPAVTGGLEELNVKADINLAGGAIASGAGATVSLGYPDADGDGIFDGTSFRARDLRVYRFNTASNLWEALPSEGFDSERRLVSGRTTGFSFFALFGIPTTNLSRMRMYPNPFKPNSGSPDDGREFSPSDSNSGVVFDMLPETVSVEIYTLSGRLVRRLESFASGGRLQWDARDDTGNAVVSGIYFAVVESPGEGKRIKKLAVIR